MGPALFGFRLVRFLWPPRFYKALKMAPDVALDRLERCPGDGTALRPLATLVGNEGRQQIEVGCCPGCGYVGFCDRPNRAWFQDFYRRVWDEAETKDVAAEVRKYKALGAHTPLTPSFHLWGPSARRDRPVLEIGCGYGRELLGMRSLGFSSIVGIENSEHRARVAREAYGLDVFSAPFEDDGLQAELKRLAPFGIIFAHHVLEHVHDPARFIELAAGLQDEGDYLIFMLPNVEGETSGGVLFYLPHLHGFTPLTLRNLFSSRGYRVDDSLTTETTNYVVARKTGAVYPRDAADQDQCGVMVEKFRRGLGLGIEYPKARRILWWLRLLDVGGQTPVWHRAFVFPQWLWLSKFDSARRHKDVLTAVFGEDRFKRKRQHLSGLMGAVVEALPGRFTAFDESPIEIQFAGDITLFYK